MVIRNAIAAVLLLVFFRAAVADGGISGGVAFGSFIALLIMGVVAASVILILAVYLKYRSKIVFLLFPFYVAIGIGALYSLQFFHVWMVAPTSLLVLVLVTSAFVSWIKSGR